MSETSMPSDFDLTAEKARGEVKSTEPSLAAPSVLQVGYRPREEEAQPGDIEWSANQQQVLPTRRVPESKMASHSEQV